MTFSLQHWRNPRKTIATRFQNDDIAYATHGALVAVECLRRLNISGSDAASLHLLDYGCGTGRMSRVLAGYFGKVTAYDPVTECIVEGMRECAIPLSNILYTDQKSQLTTKTFGVVVSVNVLEHLNPDGQKQMLDIIKSVAKKDAPILMWYSLRTNRQSLIDAFGRGEWVADDDVWVEKHPESYIQTRIFRNP